MPSTRVGSGAPEPRPGRGRPVRVTLVDDDELTSRGLASMLRGQEQIELVSVATRDVKPIDVALYDHARSGPSRERRLEQLLADRHLRKIAIFTWNFQPWSAAELIEQGASGYLAKRLTSGELVEALQTISSGEVAVCAGAVSSGSATGRRTDRGELLTGREADVLSHIASGYSNAEIAETLNLSVNSVKSYIRACYRKIDVESRSQAVLWGLAHGFGGPGATASETGKPPAHLMAVDGERTPAGLAM